MEHDAGSTTGSVHAYRSDVGPGDPPGTRDLGVARLTKLSVSEMHNNVYLLTDSASGESLLVDAADDWPTIAAMVRADGGTVRQIATTHRHWDHTRALPAAVEATGARTLAGADDADDLPVPVDHPLHDGDTIMVGDLPVDVIAVGGHTPGSIALAVTDASGVRHLLTGDSLFPGGVGATDHYDYQSFPQLIDDVQERIFGRYDDSSVVYPGHGADTTLGAERDSLPTWRERGW